MTAWQLPGVVPDLPPGDGSPRAAVLAPIFEDDGVLRLILTKRPMHMPTHAGDLAFPGGKPLDGETPVETALRETHEEVGIHPGDVEVLGFLPQIHTVSYARMVVPVVGKLAAPPVLRPDPSEVDRVLLPPVDGFRDADSWRIERWDGRPVHFFDVEGEILWGATARMVRQLVGLGDW